MHLKVLGHEQVVGRRVDGGERVPPHVAVRHLLSQLAWLVRGKHSEQHKMRHPC